MAGAVFARLRFYQGGAGNPPRKTGPGGPEPLHRLTMKRKSSPVIASGAAETASAMRPHPVALEQALAPEQLCKLLGIALAG